MSKELIEESEYIKATQGKTGLKSYQELMDDFKKRCYLCGADMALFEIRQINDGKYMYFHKPMMVLCNSCLSLAELEYDSYDRNFIHWFMGLIK